MAMDAYWREGPRGMSVNEVCRRAGVSKPGLYREFGDEDGLIDAVLGRYTERVLVPGWTAMAAEQSFLDALTAAIAFMTRDPAADPLGCLYAKLHSFPSGLGASSRSHLDRLRQKAVAIYAEWVERAKERREIDATIATQLAAEFINAQFIHILTQVAAGEDRELVRAQAKISFAGLTIPHEKPTWDGATT